MNIDKDINRCKELIKTEHSNWIGMSNQDAISNVLIDRETWKKIAEKLAERLAKTSDYSYEGNNFYYCEAIEDTCKISEVSIPNEVCKQCIIDWARNEVENEGDKI